jgi:alkanesulfonate monooxygenase SsuD/methylene tetrahydromethanopterin reductase-like flavin-dependent oxidoreductase (luciferase family)
MKFYYFGGVMGDSTNLKSPSSLNNHNFSGVMFTHDIPEGDMFVKTAKDIKQGEEIKYLVAIRPYTISPQYLSMINRSIDKIDRGRLQINLISGYIKDHEEDVGGIVGDVNDGSSALDRSNYMIEFLKVLNEMDQDKESPGYWRDPNHKNKLDVYVSTTNSYVFEAAKKYGHKIILPYHIYARGGWSDFLKDPSISIPLELDGVEIMLAITPIIRETEEELSLLTNYAMRPVWQKGEIPKVVLDAAYFTHEQFDDFIETLEKRGINHLLINSVPSEEVEVIVPFIKNYVQSRKGFVSNKLTNE